MNAREQLLEIAEWLGWQDESLSFGLRHSFDALRLYDYAQSHPNLPEMADEWKPRDRILACGYDPLATPEASAGREVEATGATTAVNTLRAARSLIDMVAFVAMVGDKEPVVEAIDEILGK